MLCPHSRLNVRRCLADEHETGSNNIIVLVASVCRRRPNHRRHGGRQDVSALSIALFCGWLAKASALPPIGPGLAVAFLFVWLHHDSLALDGLTSRLSIGFLLLFGLFMLTSERRFDFIRLLVFGIALLSLRRSAARS
jgi:hypothetical protein